MSRRLHWMAAFAAAALGAQLLLFVTSGAADGSRLSPEEASAVWGAGSGGCVVTALDQDFYGCEHPDGRCPAQNNAEETEDPGQNHVEHDPSCHYTDDDGRYIPCSSIYVSRPGCS